MKKAQMVGHIFIYIIAIVVFSLTILYGYKAINFFIERGSEVSFIQMESSIKTDIDKVKSDTRGTVKKKELVIPGGFEEVCFASSIGKPGRGSGITYPLIQNAIAASSNNMFLFPPGDVGFDIGTIEVEISGTNCIKISSQRVTLRLESAGTHVKLSEWPS